MGESSPVQNKKRSGSLYLCKSGKRELILQELGREAVLRACREMPREKMSRQGPAHLTDAELVQIVLQSGTAQNGVQCVAERAVSFLREHYPELRHDYRLFLRKLMRIRGIGKAKAACILAAIEFSNRLQETAARAVKNTGDVMPLLAFLAEKKQEYFVCISLNGGNRLISRRVVTIGLVDQALVHPREVFAEALKERAAKLIVAHNHPAGDVSPSSEDMKVTRTLMEASSILGLDLLDHIIVSGSRYFSFREEGLL